MKKNGYTLIELMIALSLGMFLILGVSMSYLSVKETVKVTQDLAHVQEVIRYSDQVFTRSIKQTNAEPEILNEGCMLLLHQDANTLSCQGTKPEVEYSESYFVENNFLMCRINDTDTPLLKGVEAIDFKRLSANTELVTIELTPNHLPRQFSKSINIDIAATRLILEHAFRPIS